MPLAWREPDIIHADVGTHAEGVVAEAAVVRVVVGFAVEVGVVRGESSFGVDGFGKILTAGCFLSFKKK